MSTSLFLNLKFYKSKSSWTSSWESKNPTQEQRETTKAPLHFLAYKYRLIKQLNRNLITMVLIIDYLSTANILKQLFDQL